MRALVLSDVHGNIDALMGLDQWRASQPAFDAIWLLGDLVDYGGDPGSVVEWARAHATVVIRGNHDHAMATGEGCGSSAAFLDLSVATREHFRARLPRSAFEYLSQLPFAMDIERDGGARCVLTHACPRDPLFGYVTRDASDEIWHEAIRPAGDPAFLFVGHTHEQFARTVGRTRIVNPGSLGLPTDGDPRAAFAVFDDGAIAFHRIEYDVDRAVARIRAMHLDARHAAHLERILRRARVPVVTPG